MNTDWEMGIAFVLEAEGGYTFDPNDRGGETMLGISRKYHPDWPGWGVVDMHKATPSFPANVNADSGLLQSAKDFYRLHFWQACHCDELPTALAISVFDAAVNQGEGTAKRMLQIALNVTVDGIVGDQTITAAFKSGPNIVRRFMAQRMARYMRLVMKDPTQEVFVENWSNRLMKLAQLIFGFKPPEIA